jgi:hypothetical protein
MRILPALLLVALALAASAAGCASAPAVTPEVTPAPVTSLAGAVAPEITVEVLGLTPQYSVDKPFSYLAQVRTTNPTGADATGVAVVVRLVETATGDVADTKNVLIERFVPGDTKIYTVRLSGDADREYRVETDVLVNQS